MGLKAQIQNSPERFQSVPGCSKMFSNGVVHIGQIAHDEPEGGAFAYGALYTKAEAMLLEDGLGDGKTQTGALLARV